MTWHRCAVWLLGVGLALAALGPGAAAQSCRAWATGPVSVLLPAATAPAEAFVQGAEGAWHPADAKVTGTRSRFDLSAADAAAPGGAVLVPARPAWMTLEDDASPTLSAALAGERELPLSATGVDAGTVPMGEITLNFECADAANPLDPAIEVSVDGDTPGPHPAQSTAGLDGVSRSGRVSLAFTALHPGTYSGVLTVRDRSPRSHALRLPWSFRVLGITPAGDRSQVRLATPVGDFVFQAGREQQLRLPDGRWAKLTTCHEGTWLYPRQITAIAGPEAVPQGQRVKVTANAQGLEGQPIEGRGRLEYEFTVRADVPALLVVTRSVNLLPGAQRMEANWGWLAGGYYVTPTGRCEWTGKKTDRYVAIGKLDWLWLAPPGGSGSRGLAWISPRRFGESRFDTMLLYGDTRSCGPEQSVDMEFAIAPADAPEQAAALAAQLTALGLGQATAAP